MPQLVIQTNELSAASAGVPNNTGTSFVVGLTDEGPPTTGPAYVACQSISAYTAAFGPRSSTSAVLYDWLDEYFQDSGGGVAYVARVTDATAVKATLTLNDVTPHPTVVVTSATAGTEGNTVHVQVTNATAATFTATTTTSSPNLTVISSMANIGIGTLVTGTGIPAGTYLLSVNTGASSAVMSANITGSGSAGVVVTPGTYTVLIKDTSGTLLETHGPYATTAQLYADTTSTTVVFSQSAGSGFTANQPTTLASTVLAGGANANDITDSSYVSTLTTFPAGLGPGTVTIPAGTTTTIWSGLLNHAQANNRFAVLDMADSPTAATVAAAAAVLTSANESYGMFIQGSLTLPGLTPGTTRTAAGSAAVAALRARVGVTASQNRAPAGPGWPITYPLGFTEYFGPTGTSTAPAGAFSAADVATLESAGVNVFANYAGVPCLFGFVTPVSKTTDATFWQASASCERMSLVNDAETVTAPFLFTTIDGAGDDTTALLTVLAGIISRHWTAKSLYGTTASDAGVVNVGPPINTPQTAQAGQLNAELKVRISPYADLVTIVITTVPITQAIA